MGAHVLANGMTINSRLCRRIAQSMYGRSSGLYLVPASTRQPISSHGAFNVSLARLAFALPSLVHFQIAYVGSGNRCDRNPPCASEPNPSIVKVRARWGSSVFLTVLTTP